MNSNSNDDFVKQTIKKLKDFILEEYENELKSNLLQHKWYVDIDFNKIIKFEVKLNRRSNHYLVLMQYLIYDK